MVSRSDSQIGNIFKLLEKGNSSAKKKHTPLQKMMKSLAKYLTVAAVLLSVVIVPLLGLIMRKNWKDVLLAGLSLAFGMKKERKNLLLKQKSLSCILF